MWLCRTIARSPRSLPAVSSASRPGTAGSRVASATADGEEVQRSLQPARSQLEVPGGDRGHEAFVERRGEPQRPMDTVPAEPDRQLVGAQLAGVKDAEDLDPGEVGLE